MPQSAHEEEARLQPPADAAPWRQALREGLVCGSLAALLSTATMAALARRAGGSAVAPLNAVSHWLWGDAALREDRASWATTGTAYVTHHLSAVFWATLYARLHGHRPEAKRWPQAVAGGLATSAAAAAIDYTLVPKRLTPGFENRLATRDTVAVFGSLAAGLALGALLLRGR